MQSLMICLTFITLLFFASQANGLFCADNPCDLGGYYTASKGYRCLDRGSDAFCYCPGGDYEVDQPCRLCNRTDPRRNPCGPLGVCLEIDTYGTSYACVCPNPLGSGPPFFTTDWGCSNAVTVTPRPTTTIATSVSQCSNGGVFVNGLCNCPSGYGGPFCDIMTERNLCERIFCLNGGICGVRRPNGPPESYCACRPGTSGDYCELSATVGACSSASCSNGGVCKETRVNSITYAYCYCPAGFTGAKCQDQTFRCPGAGTYTDNIMFSQGKYFECTLVQGVLRATQKSCPKGLRYNLGLKLCTY